MRPRKISFEDLLTQNKHEILKDKKKLDSIDQKVESKQLNLEYKKKPTVVSY